MTRAWRVPAQGLLGTLITLRLLVGASKSTSIRPLDRIKNDS
jgi:hypothetical protein